MKTTIGFKVESELAELVDAQFNEAKKTNPELTKGDFFETIVKSYFSTEKNEKNNSDNVFLQSLYKVLDIDQDNTDQDIVFSEIAKIKQRAMAIPDKVIETVSESMAENEIRFAIPEPHLALLKETVLRLSEKMDQQVTMKDVLLDMFVKYTVEQFSQWFYPFVINGDDFTEITGYTQKQLIQWLKAKNQQA